MKQAIVILIGILVIAVAIYNRWRLLRRARLALEAMAATLGIKRRVTETDEELRARCRAVVSNVPRFSRESLATYVKDALWEHGFRRLDVAITEVSPGRLRVHAMTKVPCDVLRAVEREIADQIPMTVSLELTADP